MSLSLINANFEYSVTFHDQWYNQAILITDQSIFSRENRGVKIDNVYIDKFLSTNSLFNPFLKIALNHFIMTNDFFAYLRMKQIYVYMYNFFSLLLSNSEYAYTNIKNVRNCIWNLHSFALFCTNTVFGLYAKMISTAKYCF